MLVRRPAGNRTRRPHAGQRARKVAVSTGPGCWPGTCCKTRRGGHHQVMHVGWHRRGARRCRMHDRPRTAAVPRRRTAGAVGQGGRDADPERAQDRRLRPAAEEGDGQPRAGRSAQAGLRARSADRARGADRRGRDPAGRARRRAGAWRARARRRRALGARGAGVGDAGARRGDARHRHPGVVRRRGRGRRRARDSRGERAVRGSSPRCAASERCPRR